MDLTCGGCHEAFPDATKLRNHERDYHVHAIYYGDCQATLMRGNSGFYTCPVCETQVRTTRGMQKHIGRHGLPTSGSRKRNVPQDDMEANESMKETPAKSVSNLEHSPLAPFSVMAPTPKPLKVMSRKKGILSATDGLITSAKEQEDKLMLSKIMCSTPIVLNDGEEEYGLLTSRRNASILLQREHSKGSFYEPSEDSEEDGVTSSTIKQDHTLQHIKNSSKTSYMLQDTQHEEMTAEHCDILNGDWLQRPQLRYCTAVLLAGAILVDQEKAILLNTVEPYCRDTQLDAHYEKRTPGSPASFPSRLGRYKYLNICLLDSPDGKKLVIGTGTCNFLVTASCRLDCISVNVGPQTTHFIPSSTTRVFLDKLAVEEANKILNDREVHRTQPIPSLFMLRQVRSKFDFLSTYKMCRASSLAASRLEFQPCTIWTLCDQESTHHAAPSQERLASQLFRIIANEVIKDGKKATLSLVAVEGLLDEAKQESRLAKALESIKELYKGSDRMPIINNSQLNSVLVTLASIISNKAENLKKKTTITNAIYH